MLHIRCSFLGKTVAYKRGQRLELGYMACVCMAVPMSVSAPFPAAQQPSTTQRSSQSRMIFPLKSGHIKPFLKLMFFQLSSGPHFQALVPSRTLQDVSPGYPASAFCPQSHGCTENPRDQLHLPGGQGEMASN